MDDFSILISGASVSGLSAAYWLSRYGFKVTVVEREPHLRPGGQALDVRGAAALEVAERMGISAELRERSTKLHGMSIVDRTGREIFRSTERSFTGGDFASSDVEILRDDLCAVLHAAVGDRAEYLFDDSIASLNTDETGVDVAFVNGEPRRFDLVVGADGMRSNVRRLVFGPDQKFIRYLGNYIGVFGAPNFLGLDHWQTFCMEGEIVGGVLALAKDADMRVYLGFASEQPVDYDYHDIAAQKQLLAACGTGASWVFPELIAHMQAASDFYFDSTSQIRMDHWSHGRVVLLGDAGYSVSVATGQGTSVAMIAAYVLAGELAMHRREPVAGIIRYEHELRDYVSRNQDLVDVTSHALPEPTGDDGLIDPDSLADFGKIAVPFDLKSYEQVTRA